MGSYDKRRLRRVADAEPAVVARKEAASLKETIVDVVFSKIVFKIEESNVRQDMPVFDESCTCSQIIPSKLSGPYFTVNVKSWCNPVKDTVTVIFVVTVSSHILRCAIFQTQLMRAKRAAIFLITSFPAAHHLILFL
jgi:hypothetical protein